METGQNAVPDQLQANEDIILQTLICQRKITFHNTRRRRRREEAAASNEDFIPEIPHTGLTRALV